MKKIDNIGLDLKTLNREQLISIEGGVYGYISRFAKTLLVLIGVKVF